MMNTSLEVESLDSQIKKHLAGGKGFLRSRITDSVALPLPTVKCERG